jgi:glycosyltransferase involved in cell wall biosynthesis
VWVVSELYYPEETSTGHYLTIIAEGLAGEAETRVLCGQPTYSQRGTRAPAREVHAGVAIRRCAGTALDKDVIPLKLINIATLGASVGWHALTRFRTGDVVLVVTTPPLFPLLVLAACRLRGARSILLVHDVFPDSAIAAGLLAPASLAARLFAAVNRRLYRLADRVCAVGRDMAELIARKTGPMRAPIAVIPNWADEDDVHPGPRRDNPLLRELGLLDAFVVQYAGNMGRVHDLESIVAAARIVGAGDRTVRFLFIGFGAKRGWLEAQIQKHALGNAILLPNRPRADQQNFLNACDVSISAFVDGMVGVGVPSRMYNVLAAGKPMIAAMDEESEQARVIREEDVGWVVRPGDGPGLAAAVLEAKRDPARLQAMGVRARAAAEGRYSRASAVAQFRVLAGGLVASDG